MSVDATSGREQWVWQAPEHIRMGAPAVGASAVVVGGTDGRVVKLDKRTGSVQWEVMFDDVVTAPPLIAGPNVFVATLGKELAGLNLHTGEISWHTELEGRVKSAMAVTGGGLLVLTEPKRVVFFKPASEPERRHQNRGWRMKARMTISILLILLLGISDVVAQVKRVSVTSNVDSAAVFIDDAWVGRAADSPFFRCF